MNASEGLKFLRNLVEVSEDGGLSVDWKKAIKSVASLVSMSEPWPAVTVSYPPTQWTPTQTPWPGTALPTQPTIYPVISYNTATDSKPRISGCVSVHDDTIVNVAPEPSVGSYPPVADSTGYVEPLRGSDGKYAEMPSIEPYWRKG